MKIIRSICINIISKGGISTLTTKKNNKTNKKTMLVKRNVYFSAIDESGEERLYSTNEVISEEDYLEMLFSDNEDDEDEDSKLAAAIAAAKGAGAGLGTAGLGAAGMYGAGKLGEVIRNKRLKANGLAAQEEAKSSLEALVGAGKTVKAAGSKEAGLVEKNLLKAGELLRGNKKIAAGVTTGLGVTGLATGYGVHKVKSHKKRKKSND